MKRCICLKDINDVKTIVILILGKPALIPSLSCLTIFCLRNHKDLLEDELEPIQISDLLFEERAIDILAHDRITETVSRRKQIKNLLETVEGSRRDCFHFFLFILQNKFQNICSELKHPTLAAVRDNTFNETSSMTYEVAKAQGIKLSICNLVWTAVIVSIWKKKIYLIAYVIN